MTGLLRGSPAWVGLCVLVSCGAPESLAQGDVGVLVFSRTEGFRHASIEPGTRALTRLAQEAGYRVDATEDPAAFTPATLARYRAVVFLSTTGDVLDEPQQAALTGFVRGGGGFVGIHAASDTEYDWPWYGRLVGAYFDGHPNNPNVRTATLRVARPDHPATQSLPPTWTRSDEWYDFRDFQEGLVVLLEVDELSYKRPEENPESAPRPIAWYREFDGGRSFYTALGHTAESFAEPLFLEHVRGGLAWALGG